MAFKFINNAEAMSSEGEIAEKILQEQALWSDSKSINASKKTRNIFDWGQEEEDVENQTMEMFGDNIMGINTHDFQEAHNFLKQSRKDSTSGNEFSDGFGEIPGSTRDLGISLKTVAASARKREVVSQVIGIEKDSKSAQNTSTSKVTSSNLPDSGREYGKLLSLLEKPKHQNEAVKGEKWTAIPPSDVIKRIVLGKSYSLECYKSLNAKLELLDCSLEMHDGNAITAVIVFLKRTLKPKMFLLHLKKRSQAINHYARYLEAKGDWTTLLDLHLQLDRKEDAMVLKYQYLSKLDNPAVKLQEIQKLQSEYKNEHTVFEMASYVEQESCLLEKQIKIEHDDRDTEKQGRNAMMRYHPRMTSVPLKSLLTTIYYCTLYHFEKPAHQYHPSCLKSEFKLTDKQYEWTVLPARAKLHRWTDISDILTTTNWLRQKIDRSYIGFDNVTHILHTANAPLNIIERYVRCIESPDLRLKLAAACKCHDAAIETIVLMRDRHKLEQYRQNVVHDERLRRLITNHLSERLKWK